MNEFKPMKALIGGLIEPLAPPSPESLIWADVINAVYSAIQGNMDMDDIIEILESRWDVALKGKMKELCSTMYDEGCKIASPFGGQGLSKGEIERKEELLKDIK